MSPILPLPPETLGHRCDPATLGIDSTAGAAGDTRVFGQDRAARALASAIGMAGADGHVFVMGSPGTGRRSLVNEALAARDGGGPAPSDWVYLNDFAAPQRPKALALPAGFGARLRGDMEQLVSDLRSAIPALFESEEYTQRVEALDAEFTRRRDEAIAAIAADAQKESVRLVRTPAGFAFMPVKDDELLDPEAFSNLPEEDRARFARVIEALQARMEKAIRDSVRARKERDERLAAINREMVTFAAAHLIDDIAGRYESVPAVLDYLEAVRDDVLENADIFRQQGENGGMPFAPGLQLRRYAVNLLVDRRDAKTAEPVFCDHPTFMNLVGRIEHLQHLGTLVTDFTLIRPGALHAANGGYLLLDALKLLTQPFAWEALKRALWRREVRIESADDWFGLRSTVSLEPEPIPLSVRVILMGERHLYYLLQAYDPDFPRLFPFVAELDDAIDREARSCQAHARLVAGLAAERKLLPFDRDSVACTIDESSRRAGDAHKLSADREALARLLNEADYLARKAGAALVTGQHVKDAMRSRRERADRLRLAMREQLVRGTILVDTDGEAVGQVNALYVVDLGEYPFGEPARVTATTRVGDGEVIDIQREAQLSGAVHAKAVMILSQFLAARYSGPRPHCLAASVVFEQTYGMVEGDSASLAELCALLSSLADAPIRQSLAVTGSVNQRGEVQAVGGVNEKIEGFFDLCRARGLTGAQGVIIPAANVEHLVLDDEVIEAARQGRFHVHAVRTVDEAMELLTGLPAGEPQLKGAGAPEGVNGRVARRLRDFARRRSPAPVRTLVKVTGRRRTVVD
jgi:lon-related putative ATP-dependent protease